MSDAQPARVGRPQATTHEAIETAAFELFNTQGFEETTLEDIAATVGVGRRTLFRYFPSKNDIPWGRFDEGLARLRLQLASTPNDVPVLDAVHQAVLEFNRLEPDAVTQHRQRMTLILTTPALQAHSALRYAQWREVIARFAATRWRGDPDDFYPRTIGHVSLALSLSAYEQWLKDPDASLIELLSQTAPLLRHYVADEPPPRTRRHPGRKGAQSRA